MFTRKPLLTLILAATIAPTAMADITIGVSIPLTGAASSLGIPLQNQVKLWPTQIAGEKLNVVLLDDATDPNKGVDNARRFVDAKADLVMGSIVTPIAAGMAQVLGEAQTPQFALAPVMLPAGTKDTWLFRMAQGTPLMASIMVDHMKRSGVKTVGFLGYADAFGEGWLTEINKLLAQPGAPKMVAVERFARTDASATAQAIKLVAANPDAVIVVASGGGAAMPQRSLNERGYKGKVFQTHAAASRDFIRLAGKDAEGARVLAGPSVIPEQLPSSHPAKPFATDFVKQYEGAYGVGSRAIFAASVFDLMVILQKAVPVALKSAKPGTVGFRTALRDAIERMGPTPMSNGVMNFSAEDHWGHTTHSGVMVQVKNGDWKLE